MERFQGNGRVLADMYVTTEVPFYATSVHCGIVPIAHSRAGLRSETGTSESTSLLPMFQFAAQSRSWEGTIVFAGL
jgi:hypothetical protein